MPNKRRKRRKYQIRDEAFIRYVVSSIKSIPNNGIKYNLDDYERYAIFRPTQWAREAPMEEILAVCAKLGIKLTLIGMDERNPMQAYEIAKGVREFYRTKDVNALLEIAAKHKFFCMSGSTILKNLGMYSQLVNGDMYVPNKDYAAFMAIGLLDGKLTSDLALAADEIIGRNYIMNGTENLSSDDLAVLYTIRKHDDMPLGSVSIHSYLTYNRSSQKVKRSLAKLVAGKYIYMYGNKNNAMYSVAEKGWMVLNQIREEVFKKALISSFEIRDQILKIYAEQSATEKHVRKKAVA